MHILRGNKYIKLTATARVTPSSSIFPRCPQNTVLTKIIK